jgi:hypothetical protein
MDRPFNETSINGPGFGGGPFVESSPPPFLSHEVLSDER